MCLFGELAWRGTGPGDIDPRLNTAGIGDAEGLLRMEETSDIRNGSTCYPGFTAVCW